MQAAEEDFEAGRPQVPRRARSSSANAESRGARADADGARPVGVGRRDRADACARTTSTCRASATSTAGRTRRTKAGCAPRSTPTACPTPTSPTSSCARATCAQKYDVIVYPARRRQRAVAGQRAFRRPAGAPLPYRKTADTPNLGAHRSGRRHPRRHGLGRADGAGRSSCSEGGTLITEGSTSTIFPEYNITSGVTVESPDGPVRARIGHARHRSPIAAARSPTATTRRCRCTSTRIRC